MSDARQKLKARLHEALFGDCCGYDLEHAKHLTPQVEGDAKRLRLTTSLNRLRNRNPFVEHDDDE